MSTKNIFVAIFIFFCGFLFEFILNTIANKHTHYLLEKPEEDPDYDYFYDDEEEEY